MGLCSLLMPATATSPYQRWLHDVLHTCPFCQCCMLITMLLLLLPLQVLLKPDGEPDYTSAALLLDHMAHMLLPRVPQLGGPNIAMCLGAFVKCRYTPSGMWGQDAPNCSQQHALVRIQLIRGCMYAESQLIADSATFFLFFT